MMTNQRDPDLPPPGRGIADWYITRKATSAPDRPCGHRRKECPQVLEYRPEADHGGVQKRLHPRWPVTGWLTYWQCPTCGYISPYEVVSAAQVATWGRELGGWHPAS